MTDCAIVEFYDQAAARFQTRPPPLCLEDFARGLTLPDITDDRGRPVQYDPASHPVQYHAIRLLDGVYGTEQEILIVGDSQGLGKSWLAQVKTFHVMVEHGESLIYGLPNENLWGDTWEQKIRPAIVGAGLDRFMPLRGSGSRDGSAPKRLRFRKVNGKGGGSLLPRSTHGRKEANQASLTVRALLLDEFDEWLPDAVHRIRRRVDRWFHMGLAVIIMATTIKSDVDGLAWTFWATSKQGRVEYRCPQCGKFGILSWDTFDPGPATIGCVHGCGATWDDAARAAILDDVANTRFAWQNPTGHGGSIMGTALECPWKTLRGLADEYNAAELDRQAGRHARMRQFERDQRVNPYKDESERTNVNGYELALKSSRQFEYSLADDSMWGVPTLIGASHAPDWVTLVVAAIDIQQDRIFILLLGSAVLDDGSARFAILGWGEEYYARKDEIAAGIDDTLRIAKLTEVQRRLVFEGVVTGTGEVIQVHATVADVGYKTDEINGWIKKTPNTHVMRGDTSDGRTKEGLVGSKRVRSYVSDLLVKRKYLEPARSQARTWWWCRTAAVRDVIHNDLLLDDDQPGSIAVPGGLAVDDLLCKHLSAWRLVHDEKTGRDKWLKKGRDDLDDALCYSWVYTKMLHERGITATTAPPAATKQDLPNAPRRGSYLDIDAGVT